jgi:hypothetical protein
MPPENAPDPNVCRAAIQVLQEKGWNQGHLRKGNDTVCLIGAVLTAADAPLVYDTLHQGSELFDPAALTALTACVDVIREQFPHSTSSTDLVDTAWIFNDQSNRTQADVELVLDKAAVRLDEAL